MPGGCCANGCAMLIMVGTQQVQTLASGQGIRDLRRTSVVAPAMDTDCGAGQRFQFGPPLVQVVEPLQCRVGTVPRQDSLDAFGAQYHLPDLHMFTVVRFNVLSVPRAPGLCRLRGRARDEMVTLMCGGHDSGRMSESRAVESTGKQSRRRVSVLWEGKSSVVVACKVLV